MKLGPAKHIIALLLAAPLLAGCLERGQPTMVDTSADDDAFCRANNVVVGRTITSIVARTARPARQYQRPRRRVQRNMAEQMLNNLVRL